ncbi:MAG: hypothetical protein DRJ69_03550 [Thermoprotei archaeon]|nr:MAG: hypothetical protein DRJ69_03550 [Thermoprotei archaeon]
MIMWLIKAAGHLVRYMPAKLIETSIRMFPHILNLTVKETLIADNCTLDSFFTSIGPSRLSCFTAPFAVSKTTPRIIELDSICVPYFERVLGELNEQTFNEYIRSGRLFDDIKHAINEKKFDNECMRHIVEEYLHQQMSAATSIASRIDALSWSLRMRSMYLTELIHRMTKIPRLCKRLPTISKEKDLETIADKISSDTLNIKIFKEMIAQYTLLYGVYAAAMEPIIEAATSYIMEEDPKDSLIKRYACEENKLRKILDYLDIIEQHYRERADIINELVDAVRKCLDIPLETLTTIEGKEGYEGKLNGLHQVIKERIIKILRGEDVPIEKSERKNFRGTLRYLLKPKDTNSRIVSVLSYNLSKNKEVVKYLIERFSEIIDRPVSSAIFLKLPGEPSRCLRYDPFADPLRMNEVEVIVDGDKIRFSTMEDIVGDLPLLHRAFLHVIIGPLKKYTEDQNLIRDSIKFYHFVRDTVVIFGNMPLEVMGKLAYAILEVRDHIKRINNYIGVNSTIDDYKSALKEYIKAWVRFVLALGEDCKYFMGLHGIW